MKESQREVRDQGITNSQDYICFKLRKGKLTQLAVLVEVPSVGQHVCLFLPHWQLQVLLSCRKGVSEHSTTTKSSDGPQLSRAYVQCICVFLCAMPVRICGNTCVCVCVCVPVPEQRVRILLRILLMSQGSTTSCSCPTTMFVPCKEQC